ncbi:hypothetical protein V8B97DRAFT_2002060 [Scleroderma yunnanense]
MDSRQLIDAQFERAVEIVQGLPKTGPIQTGYEDKLNMYSLYKQGTWSFDGEFKTEFNFSYLLATLGNVTSSRPGLWDMLGRAKWDAWAKLKGMEPSEAKWRYVDALLKSLSKYSDTTTARDLIDELQSYSLAQNPALGHSLTRPISSGSDSTGSTTSNNSPLLPPAFITQPSGVRDLIQHIDGDVSEQGSDGSETGDEARELPSLREPSVRPLSSISSRYRTPLTSSFATSPSPRRASIPAMQPLALYESESAFERPQSASMASSSLHPSTVSATLPGTFPTSLHELSPQVHSALPHQRGQHLLPPLRSYTISGPPRPSSRTIIPLELAVENVQAHLAALTERLDTLESSISTQPQRSVASMPSMSSSGRGSPTRIRTESFEWDVDDMGLWSYVLKPLSRGVQYLRRLLVFILRSENQSPVLVIVRRLCLDISFTLAVLTLLKLAWRKSRTRRREINTALGILWAALTGNNRRLISRAV